MRAIHMAGVTGILLLALLVALAGLYMLSHSKKENLNKFYSISSLVAVIFASCVFIFGLACGIMCMACGKGHCGPDGDMKHHRMMMHKMHGGCNPHGMMMGGCDEMGGNCMMHMGKGGCDKMMNCKMHNEKCSMMGGGNCKMMDGDEGKCGGAMKKEITIQVEDKDGKKTETKTEVR